MYNLFTEEQLKERSNRTPLLTRQSGGPDDLPSDGDDRIQGLAYYSPDAVVNNSSRNGSPGAVANNPSQNGSPEEVRNNALEDDWRNCCITIGISAFWETTYWSSAAQAMFNAWAAMSYLVYQDKCSVGNFYCYSPSAWRDTASIFVWWEVSCTFLANVAIAKVFMPPAMVKFKEIVNLKGIYDWVAAIPQKGVYASLLTVNYRGIFALILAAACAIVSYKLGVDSLTLFQNLAKGKGAVIEGLGLAADMYMLITSVASTFATRIVGCDTMLGVFMRWLPYVYDSKRSQLLTMMHDCTRFEYNLEPENRLQYLNSMAKENISHISVQDYIDAYQLMSVKSAGFSESCAHYAVTAFKMLCYFLAIACYPIVYNITYSAFEGLNGWSETSYVASLANVLFYTYALGRLPEEIYRACQRYSWPKMTCGRGAWLSIAFPLVVLGAAGSLLYAALNQTRLGKLDFLGCDRMVTLILFAIVGAAMSGLTNAFGLFRIDRMNFDPEYTRSDTAIKNWTYFVDNGNSAEQDQVIENFVIPVSTTARWVDFWKKSDASYEVLAQAGNPLTV